MENLHTLLSSNSISRYLSENGFCQNAPGDRYLSVHSSTAHIRSNWETIQTAIYGRMDMYYVYIIQ